MQHIEYVPFGEVFLEERNNKWNTPYLFNAKELDEETGLYYYGARYYDSRSSVWLSTDPLQEKYPNISTYTYCAQNPVKYTDPTGMELSTDVVKNNDGTYTVVNAKNDGDKNIYVVNNAKEQKRSGEIIGQTLTPYDFLYTNDDIGDFYFDKEMCGVTFSLNNLEITGSIKYDSKLMASIKHADGEALIKMAKGLFWKKVKEQNPSTFYGQLEILQMMSGNGATLDFKASFGLPKYTAVSMGKTTDGLSVITTLRAIGNIAFGANMRSTNPPIFGVDFYYRQVMAKVGEYNQTQNHGNGYNSGYPYYGEHTYSGSFIFYGYYGKFH